MTDLASRISALSPEKQRLLERLRQEKKGGTATRPAALSEPFSLVSPADRERLPPGLEDAYPLSMVQLGMLFHMQLTPDAPTPTYHNVNSFNLRVPFDLAALDEAAQTLVARHPILRTSFDLTGYSEPLQLVHRTAYLPIEVEDLRHLGAEEQARAIESFILEENRRLVDLSRPPLIRFHVHRRSERGIQFTLTEPHAISDGWSTMSNLSDVFAAYFALLRGEPVPEEPPITSTYRDFVYLERQVLRSEEARRFWRGLLGDWEMPRLPRWRSGASGVGGFGREERKPTFGLPGGLVEGLEGLARTAGLPFKSLLLAAHLKVMGMVTGREDAVTGITSHGRPEDRDGERVRGLFLNTIPLRVGLAGGSWLELARRALEAETTTLPFRRYPLAALQQLCGGRELFEVNFTYLHFHNVQGVVGNEKVAFAFDGHSDLSVTNFPLAVTLIRNPVAAAGVTLTLERNDPGLSLAEIRALYGWYERALAAMLAGPEDDHGSCCLLSPAERQQVVAEWNDTAVPFDTEALIHEAFEARAAAAPGAVAVVGEDGRLTYGEVEARANRLARLLVDRGVGPGSMVGIYLERSVEMVPALLAVLKAGGAYVPLSDSFPPARMEWILDSLGARHLLTQTPRLPVARELQAAVPGLAHLVCVDADEAAGLPATPLGRRAGADDLAYVIFTSGSTGRPKGVAVRHRPVVNLLEWALRTFGFGAADRVLFITALSFDLSVFDVFGLLAAGGSIHVASRRELEEPERLVRLLVEEPITFWDSAPAALQQLAPLFPEVLEAKRAEQSRLRLVFFSGDWIPLGLPGRVRAAFPGARVISLGGATEATVWSNVFPVEEIEPHWVSIPYGRPIQNARYHVLDGGLLPCPVGVPGDLYIGGGCLSSGYAAAPDLTADRYLPDPFGAEPGGRLYRTGDRARFFPDGTIEFLGRLDHQVKIRGFRIELGEIEAALGQHEGVREAVVLVREDVPGQRRLVAYVTPRREAAPAADELRRFCQARLPDYMVPAAFVALDVFPVTPNGKLDRAALPAPEEDGTGAGRGLVAPRTSMERAVAEVWASVLGREAVGVHDGFFVLGGDSLLAIQLIMRLRERLGVELPLRGLFEHPTVAEMALEVVRLRGKGGGAGSLPMVTPDPEALHEPFPLTDLQQAYWLGQRSDFDLGGMSAHVYQERDFVDLDPARLEAAWRRLVERHPMLRSVVLPDGRQRVLAEVPPYRIEALERTGEEAAELGRRMAGQGPATGTWPLFEVRLSRLDERRWRLHVSLSLLISDAVGLNVLQGELRRLYQDPETALVPLDLTFRDYVLAMAGDEGSAAFARDRGYWLERLPSLPPAPELPLRSAVPDGEARFVHYGWHLEPEGWRRFRERAARAGVTPTAAVLAAYAQVLAAWSKDPRFTLNVLYFNRLPIHPQVDRVVGNFSSTLPVEVDASGTASFEERAQRLQERLWQDLEHGRFSGVRVVRELARLHGVSSRPVLPVVFTSDINLTASEEGPTPEQVDATHFAFALQTPQVWLDHQASELAGRLVLSWQVVEGLFPEGLVESMFEAYCGLVARLGAAEDAWQSPAAVLPPPAHLALAAEANATAEPIAPRPLHAAFAEQARRTPEALAVLGATVRPEGEVVPPPLGGWVVGSGGGQEGGFSGLTYGELAGCAARLAGRLRELGAGPGRLVAVAMEKGWEQAAAVLAVLEAGAAYLPLDPGLPRERRWHLLEVGEVEVVLTQPWLEGHLDGPRELRTVTVSAADLGAAGELKGEAAPAELAYVIFTSGSTGMPKGVAIEHGSAWNTVEDVGRRFGIGPDDRVLALSALSFDLSVWDLFGPLSAGGAVVMPDAAALREPARWVELMEAGRVTVWSSVPALMEMLVDHLEGRGEPLPPSLRLVLLSGDWIPVSLPDRIRRLGRPEQRVQVVSLGGATEASIWSILYPVGPVDPAWSSIPYGRPMANQTFHVLDEGLRPRPVWVPGQLSIGGVGLAREYWRDEERTRAAFITHPETGERLYRTGDLGRRLPDGTLEFLGREDLQVKIQGYRIELGEIEAALLAHPGVRAAVATAVGPRRGAKRLVAYAVPAAGAALETDELRQFLAAKLPAYMVPAALVLLDELPLTANGKVDRQALPDPERARPGRPAVPPRDELEETLARIWSDVLGDTLGGAPVSVHDDFFELGGHSLLAVRLMGRIQAELGRELPLSVLFSAPTVEALAGLLRAAPEGGGRRALVAVQPGGPGLPFFCVHPVGGNVLCYRDLARELGGEQPFWALQSPDTPPASVAEMAAAYLEEIREVQPHGPYRLGGWSMGGVVAYEMARQLADAGEEVELLAMMDPWTPGAVDPAEVDDAVLASWFAGDLGGLAGVALAVHPDELRPLEPAARAALLLERALEAHVLPPDFGVAELSRHLETFQRNFRALLDHVPGEYAGRPVLFLAGDGGAAHRAAEVWSRLAGGAEIHLLSGDHYSIVRPPQVEALARGLGAALTREILAEA